MKYYTLLELRDPPYAHWAMAFGSYDKSEVEAKISEKLDKRLFKLIETPDSPTHIKAHIFLMNEAIDEARRKEAARTFSINGCSVIRPGEVGDDDDKGTYESEILLEGIALENLIEEVSGWENSSLSSHDFLTINLEP